MFVALIFYSPLRLLGWQEDQLDSNSCQNPVAPTGDGGVSLIANQAMPAVQRPACSEALFRAWKSGYSFQSLAFRLYAGTRIVIDRINGEPAFRK
jgi:hypothetical protein